MPARVFWASVGVIIYTHVGFPLVLWLRGRLLPRPYNRADISPYLSVIIAAHNEAANIHARLENLAAMQYPGEQIEIIVASDGSTDSTAEVVEAFGDPRVRLLRLERGGKARALNRAVQEARGEILVFTDANTIFAPDALRALVSPFADAAIGGVAGDQQYLAADSSENDGERSYWNLDRVLKTWESAAGNVVHATGAIYAIRRSLYRPIPDGLSDDFITSVGVVAAGYRLVFARDAVAFEPVAPSRAAEFRRKVRIGTRMLRSEIHVRSLLNPFRYGFYALQLLSHKPLRRLLAIPVVAIGMTTPMLAPRAPVYRLAALAQLAFYGCAAVGLLLGQTRLGTSSVFRLPGYFCMAYAAQLIAVWKVVRGQRISVWEQQRRP